MAEITFISSSGAGGATFSSPGGGVHVFPSTRGRPLYSDILILKLNTEGNLDWGRSIPKLGSETSYNFFIKEDNNLCVFTNLKKNLKDVDGKLKESRKPFTSNYLLYAFIYDSNGNVSRIKIKDNKGKMQLDPYDGNYKSGKFIIPTYSNIKYQLMILEEK